MADYISKEKAIKELREVYENEYPTASGDFDEYASHDVPNVLRNIPSADVQPVKRGRWVQYNRNGEETYIECTNCCVPSRPRHLQMVTRSGEGLPDYCPNCGARMDLGDEKHE